MIAIVTVFILSKIARACATQKHKQEKNQNILSYLPRLYRISSVTYEEATNAVLACYRKNSRMIILNSERKFYRQGIRLYSLRFDGARRRLAALNRI